MAKPKGPGKRARRRGARVRKHGGAAEAGGRATLLTEELVEAIAEAIEEGRSFRRTCKDLHITPSSFYEWIARGREDIASGQATIHARLADRLSAATVSRVWECRAAVMRGVTAASPESRLKPSRAMLAVRAGDLALKVLTHTESGARGAEKRWGPREGAGGGEQAPAAAPPPAATEGLKRLSDEDLDTLERIILKMRGAEGGG